jgi:2-deoxy-scyllo-inosamine dehydrogenase (SAM-dependent)
MTASPRIKSNWTGRIEDGWFTLVEAEINSRCNRKCSYCPVSVLPTPNVPPLIDSTVLSRLIDELARIDYAGLMALHFYGEPLLHPNLSEIVELVKRVLPKARQILYTNGDLLTDDIFETLIEKGVTRFITTSHDRRQIPEREKQVVLFPEDLELTNRGGIMSCLGSMPKLDEPLDIPCYAPSSILIVTIVGDVILCCEDARRTQVMGNIMNDSIENIWFSEGFESIRQQLINGNRRATPICTLCNKTDHRNMEVYDPKALPER